MRAHRRYDRTKLCHLRAMTFGRRFEALSHRVEDYPDLPPDFGADSDRLIAEAERARAMRRREQWAADLGVTVEVLDKALLLVREREFCERAGRVAERLKREGVGR